MRLLLMRHGVAEPLGQGRGGDAGRVLTSEGREKTRLAGLGLLAGGPRVDLIATSPLLRAVQTAGIVRDALGAGKRGSRPPLESWPELVESDVEAVWRRLRDQSPEATVLLVGHQPGMGRLAAHLLCGDASGIELEFKKAAVCALELPPGMGQASSGGATLLWHAAPWQLRLMGKSVEKSLGEVAAGPT